MDYSLIIAYAVFSAFKIKALQTTGRAGKEDSATVLAAIMKPTYDHLF